MENRAHALAAGLFTLILGAALVALGFWFSKKDDAQRIPYMVTTTGNVAGLKAEAPVRYRGVEVGSVEWIRIDPVNRGRIQIRIAVDAATPVTKATFAQLGYLGVTGLAFVSLSDSGEASEPLVSSAEQVATIRMRPSIIDSGEDLLSTLGEVAEGLSDLLDEENQQRFRRTLANVEAATAKAAAIADRLAPAIQEVPALVGEARGALRETRAAVGNLTTTAQGVAARAGELAGNLNTLALKLDGRMDNFTRAADSVAAGVDDVSATARVVQEETLPRLNSLATEVQRQSRAVDRVIQNIGDAPQSLVFGPPPPRPGPGEPGFSAGAAR